jgi:foldase protein PrsA
LARFLLTFLLTVLLLLTTFKLFYYAFSRRYRLNKLIVTAFLFLTSLAAILHGPTINDTDVSYNSYLNRVKSLSQFQEKQKQTAQTAPADASVDQIRAQSLQQLLLSNVIRQEATKYDVHVSRKEVNSTYKQYADRNQGEDNLKKQLKEFLGWTPAQFKTEIKVKLLEQKLNEKLSADDGVNKDRKQKAEDFLKQVKQDKKDFGEVAKQSDDPTAQLGGDPGFTKKGENDPALEAVIFNMNAGDISDIIKTQQGYVIVRLDEKQADQVKFRQILVKTRSLAEFIPDELKNAKVGVYVKDLGWDKSLTAVQSKNQPSQQPTESTSPAPEASAAPAPAAQ